MQVEYRQFFLPYFSLNPWNLFATYPYCFIWNYIPKKNVQHCQNLLLSALLVMRLEAWKRSSLGCKHLGVSCRICCWIKVVERKYTKNRNTSHLTSSSLSSSSPLSRSSLYLFSFRHGSEYFTHILTSWSRNENVFTAWVIKTQLIYVLLKASSFDHSNTDPSCKSQSWNKSTTQWWFFVHCV